MRKVDIVCSFKKIKMNRTLIIVFIFFGCASSKKNGTVQDVSGRHQLVPDQVWLSHEHILVNFIGAASIQSNSAYREAILKEMTPYLHELKEFNVSYFVDATPNYLGRDVLLLEKIAHETDLKIITNTGLYGARNNKFLPNYAKNSTAKALSKRWIKEFNYGIDGTKIKPGFIKIGIDNTANLSEMHQKLVKAAALTHLKTGLAIALHTGEVKALRP
jgi:phosphotriesterase-related protein